ncbi:MAG TPA: SLBB domain-containing protein [Gemmatimonadaceae bacterium]|nr:SLBB domain-containing protein [Gemmatimonadaceae bacterium]
MGRRSFKLLFASVALLVALPSVSLAQRLTSGPVSRSLASREDLEQAAENADLLARQAKDGDLRRAKLEEAARIRQRLQEGDFQAGHRIFLSVYGDSVLSDTFTVRGDRQLLLPNVPPISLNGVLDSELESFLTEQLGKYLRDPMVEAQTLLRISITGAVGAPGFYSLPIDVPVSDALMKAGGPTGTASLQDIVIKRGKDVAIEKETVRDAVRAGLTLSDIGARPGDEMWVPDQSQRSKWLTWGRGTIAVLGAIASIAWLTTRF